MKTMKTTLAASAVLAFALSAYAGSSGEAGGRNDGSRWIQLHETTVLLGATVPPGSYTLRWVREHGSEDVRLELARGRSLVAAGTGRWIESPEPSPYESMVYQSDRGKSQLSEIRFRRSADAIRVDAGTTEADAARPAATDKD